MPELKFLLSERQSACVLTGPNSGKPSTGVRKLFFSAEAQSTDQKEAATFDGRVVQHNCVINVEERVAEGDIGTIDVCDGAPLTEGTLPQVHVEVNVGLPTPMFQQLLEADMGETKIWAALSAPLPARDKYGYETANCSFVRFSLLPDAQSRGTSARDYSAILNRIFWALVVIAFGVLWRLH